MVGDRLKVMKTDKISIGESKDHDFDNFENTFSGKGNFFLFSDGITDQYGDRSEKKPYGRKLKPRRVKNFLQTIAEFSADK